jgi:hypothetical protein
MPETTIIECPTCEAKVSAKIIAQKADNEEDGTPSKVLFLECTSCHGALLGYCEIMQTDFNEWEYSRPQRLWPSPKNSISWKLPPSVRLSIEEAAACLGVRAYAACVVMCGRALESICKEHSVKNWKFKMV